MQTLFSRSVGQPLKDFLFPPLCLSCRDRLSAADVYLCVRCARALTRVDASDYTMTVMHERFAESDVISSFFPLYYFEEDGVLQHVIHALKYEEMTVLGERFGVQIGAALASEPAAADAALIIPVPLHAAKERERGYNQSACISAGIGRVLHIPVAGRIVHRQKNTRTQTKLSAGARVENMRDAFVIDNVPHPLLMKRTVLLVDDVITTGATMHSCAAVLRAAGAATVVCASIGIAKLSSGG